MKIDAAGIGANKIIWKKKSFYFKIQKKKKKKIEPRFWLR